MLPKRKITRKRNKEWRVLLTKLMAFLLVFATTLGALLILFNSDPNEFISPLSFVKKSSSAVLATEDTSKLKKLLNSKKIFTESIKISSTGAYMIELTTGEEIILSGKKDLAKQISSLQVITTRLTMEGRSLRKLDLRYDKPVVVFE